MAFELQRFVKVGTGFNAGAITSSVNPSATPVLEGGPGLFTYASATDTLAQISAANYFSSQVVSMSVGDVILASGSDGSNFYIVDALDKAAATISVVSFTVAGSVGTSNLQSSSVTTVKIADANVTLAKLAAGITPSHVVKYAARFTTVGGAASEAITITGALATDIQSVTLVNNGTNNVTLLESVLTNNTLTLTFSGNPGADAIVAYSILRAAA